MADPLAGLPPDLVRLLRDPRIKIPMDRNIDLARYVYDNVPSNTASAMTISDWQEAWLHEWQRANTAEVELDRMPEDLSKWDYAKWLQDRLGDARQQLAEAVNLVEELIAYSHLREKVRLRDDLSEYVEAERLIARADALLDGPSGVLPSRRHPGRNRA